VEALSFLPCCAVYQGGRTRTIWRAAAVNSANAVSLIHHAENLHLIRIF
jgi:hypothetical protein